MMPSLIPDGNNMPRFWAAFILLTQLVLLQACRATLPVDIVQAQCPGTNFYAIAHMTNTTEAVQFALRRGANAVELDLRFDSSGEPKEFKHGLPCDCLCFTGETCSHFGVELCRAATSSAEMLSYLSTRSELALIIIDSKISDSVPQRGAGRKLIQALEEELFDAGYPGNVLVSVSSIAAFEYLEAAAQQAAESPFRPRIVFAFDGEGNEVIKTLERLIEVPTRMRGYGTGITACLPGDFISSIRLARRNEAAGVLGMVYIWTLDKRSSMDDYIQAGAQGIITNSPSELVELLEDKGIPLAIPSCRIPPATNDIIIHQVR